MIYNTLLTSWTNTKMNEFIHSKCKKFKDNILSVKKKKLLNSMIVSLG